MEPFLASLTVEGLLSFGAVARFDFGGLNVLVGPNGSGKSNVIECLRIFKNSPGDIQQTFRDGGFEEWVSKYAHEEPVVGLDVSSTRTNQPLSHLVLFREAKRARTALGEQIAWRMGSLPEDFIFSSLPPQKPVLYPLDANRRREFERNEFDVQQSVLAQIRDPHDLVGMAMLGDFYAEWRFYTEWGFGRRSVLREPAATDSGESRLSESADNLAFVLNNLQGTRAHDRIKQKLVELKEGYSDFVTRVSFGKVGLFLRERSFESLVPAKRISDGTLRFLALASILLSDAPPPLVVIEEPELGMHPDMIRLVASMLAEASKKVQVIVTTHSEQLLTALQDDFDFLFAFDAGPDGSTVRRFSRDEHREWRAEHDLGELWTSGELGGVRY